VMDGNEINADDVFSPFKGIDPRSIQTEKKYRFNSANNIASKSKGGYQQSDFPPLFPPQEEIMYGIGKIPGEKNLDGEGYSQLVYPQRQFAQDMPYS
jgi:hypothetical protein